MAQQSNPLQAAQNNAMMRSALLATGPRMRKNVITVTAAAGQTSRIKLFNVGVVIRLQLFIQIPVTIGVATAVPSAKAPFNAISRLRLTDYDGTDRINISGFQLFLINCVRTQSFYGYNNTPANVAAFANPSVPTAVGAGTITFFIDIPLAFDIDNPVIQLQDLRGAILAQTAVGEMYLSIDWFTSYYTNGDIESLYSGAPTTTVVQNGVISATLWQEYILPQAVGANGEIPLPGIDLMTVYELNGNVRSSDNIAVGQEKLISYPNVRSVVGAYFVYVTGGTVAGTNLTQLRLIANGNNILVDHSNLSQLFYQRTKILFGDPGDTVAGAYFRSHRDKPIETALFGNVQMGITPAVASGGNQYIEIGFESFYTKGQALPGLSQAQ